MARAWDEMFAAPGQPRPPYLSLFATLQPLSGNDLRFRADQLARVFTDRGVTFAYAGEERPFPLDLIPRIIDAAEWDVVTRAVRQRVTALELFLADVYGRGAVLDDGVVPRRLVTTSAHFHRSAFGINPANGVRVHISGVDLVRDEAGAFRVLEDNLRIPSGVSYVIENRRVMTQTLPTLFADARVSPVDDYPARLLAALRAAAPEGVADPCVVVLTPGVYNAAYFEHALLARLMGVELVEGRDLVCAGNRVRMRTTHGEQPVHVVDRRVDDDEVRHDVLDRLDTLVLKPVDGAGGKGIVIGPQADESTLDSLRAAVVADPRGWIAQRPVALSTSPTLIDDRVAPRHIDLRPFAINDGSDVWLLPGGLTRVALPEGALVVNSSQGGGAKDTWVLAAEPALP